MTTTQPTDSQNVLLTRMKGVIRDGPKGPKDQELTVDDCLPLLAERYEEMGRHEDYDRQYVYISDLCIKLSTKDIRYKCSNEEKLSREICDFLTSNGIPVELYEFDDDDSDDDCDGPVPPRIVGVILKLYRS